MDPVPPPRSHPMRHSPLALALVCAALLPACQDAPSLTAGPPAPLLSSAGAVAGEYIVVLHRGAEPRGVAAAAGVSPRHVYTAALSGFSARLSGAQLNAL